MEFTVGGFELSCVREFLFFCIMSDHSIPIVLCGSNWTMLLRSKVHPDARGQSVILLPVRLPHPHSEMPSLYINYPLY